MNYLYEPSQICLTYGSIISFMYDKEGQSQGTLIPDLNGSQFLSNSEINPNLRKEEFSDILTSREFLYSQGIFNEFCFFHKFKNKNELKYNYYNTLFLVLPKGEYESMSKLRAIKRRLKKEILIDDELDIDQQNIIYFYKKFKQEIYTNQEYAIKILNSKDKSVNFNDSVQFMHIKSGKFLEFKKISGSLRIHIQLTDTLSDNTIFRFIPAFNYQGENSAKVMINLILKIACGEKQVSYENEKFLSKMDQINQSLISNLNIETSKNINPKSKALRFGKDILFKTIKKMDEVKHRTSDKIKETRNSLRKIVNAEGTHENIKNNFKLYISNSDLLFRDFGKKILPNEEQNIIAGNRTSNFWRILNFSTNFLEDNKYINSLDYFSIQNNEKNLYIQSIGSKDEKGNKSEKYNTLYENNNNIGIGEEDDSIEEIDNHNNEMSYRRSINTNKRSKYINETNITRDSTIKLNYFYNQEFNNELNFELIVNQFQENDYIEPLSLFKFEVVYSTGDYGLYGPNPTYTIDKLKDNSFVRLINVFTNKVLIVELKSTPIGNIFKLKLVNNQDIHKKDYFKSVFIIEKIQDYEELVNDEENNENKEKNDFNTNNETSKRNKKKKKEKNLLINKNEYIKIRSKKYNGYLGIRLNNEQNKRTLVLTNSISDLTKFKLNFLDEIDKYELHFFEQLIWSFENIINYFKLEDKKNANNSTEFDNFSNYEKIQHILIELENRINNFPENNKVNISQKNKFDFMKAIEHFNVVSKLVDIFLSIWFHDCENLNYYEMEKKLEIYFKDSKIDEELNLSRYKKLISKKIFKILKIIYDLNKSYLNVIVDKLIYFFMFVGRDDKCTKFLIHILKNNGTLLISLCPLFNTAKKNQLNNEQISGFNNNNPNNLLYNQNSGYNQIYPNNQFNINNNSNTFNSIGSQQTNILNREKFEKYIYLKHCLKRIIKTYNSFNIVKLKINFSSILLLFKFLNCLTVYNHKPFYQFYDEYFNDLELLKIKNGETSPNYEQNPMLVEFVLKNDKIFVKKRKFFNQKKGKKKPKFLMSLKSINDNEDEIYEGLNPTSSNQEEFEFDLLDLIEINSKKDVINNYSAIMFSKLVSLNLIFYAQLSLCNQNFKQYLQDIFDFNSIINKYLYNKKEEIDIRNSVSTNVKLSHYDIANDLKCSLLQLLNYLYFHISFPFSGKMDLFYCMENYNMSKAKINLHTSIIHNTKPKYIKENILNNIVDCMSKILLESTRTEILLNIELYFFCQLLECGKYILRNLYNYKDDEEKIQKAMDFVSLILLLLEKFIVFSLTKEILGSKNIDSVLNIIKNDRLETNDNIYLISDNSKLIFEKYRKKLKQLIKSKENISKKRLFKELFSIFISPKEEKKIFLDSETKKYSQRTLNKLRQYELSQILMEISVSKNNEHKSIIDDILFLISDIFTEFLQYLENLDIDKVYNKIYDFSKSNITKKNSKRNDKFYDNLILSIVRNTDEEIDKTNYLEGVLKQYMLHKNEENFEEDKTEDSFGEDKSDYYFEEDISKENSGKKINNSISVFFFKFLQLIDNNELKKGILEILYKANSQKKIFYQNITNIVLLDSKSDYNKLLKLKDLFINIFNTMHSINLIKRLDNNSFSLFEELNIEFENLINLLLDEEKWRRENNIFNVYGKIDYNDSKEDNKSIIRKKSIFNSEISEEQNNKFFNQYFLSEFSKERVSITQQTLYNLGFINLINQVFEYISWVVKIKNDFSKELLSLEKIVISIYKLLVVFIFDNKKHQYIIREKLYLYLCPLKLKNKSQNILLFIGYFLLNVAYFFESQDDFNQIKNLDNVIESLNILKYLDWGKNKKIIPFYVQSFKIIISFCSHEHFILLYPVLEVINHILVREIYNNSDTKDDLLSLVKILELIIKEQDKKCNENKNTPILTLDEIINVFLNMITLITQETVNKYMKLSEIFITVTNLLYKYFDIYKNDFHINKRYSKHLTEILISFNEKLKLTDDLVYCNENKNNKILRNFNEFIGISIPKLYIILSSLQINKYNKEDSFSSIINISNDLYEKILDKLEKDKKVRVFLTKKNEREVDDLLKKAGIDLYLLSFIKNNIITSGLKLSIPKLIKSLITRKNLINNLLIKDESNPESFSSIWNEIKTKINYNDGLINFQNYVKYKINKERMDYVQYLDNFFDEIYSKNKKKMTNYYILNNNYSDNSLLFFDTYIETLKENYAKDFINYKNEIYFFYWTNIHLMRYNRNIKKKKYFIDNDYTLNDILKEDIDYNENNNINEQINNTNINEVPNNNNNNDNNDNNENNDNNNNNLKQKYINYFNYNVTPFNKMYFNDLNFIELTMRQFNSVKNYANDYEYLLYIKFLNSYLDQLDEENLSKFLIFFIEQPEAENIFSVIHNILENLNKDIVKTLSKDDESNNKNDKNLGDKMKYSSDLFENNFDKYELIINFISKLSANNSIIQSKMKDYLRVQYNNSKSYNFIINLSNILTNFVSEDSHLLFIKEYYKLIIQIIDCITKCCNGPSKENQDCVVNETDLLGFARHILKNVSYRKKKENDSGLQLPNSFDRYEIDIISEKVGDKFSENYLYEDRYDNDLIIDECTYIGLDRQKLSYLKYKLLVLISVLTLGRKKEDYLYESIHNKIDFNVLACVIIETYKEILIEKNSQFHHESLIFDEDMLLRMNNNIIDSEPVNENFIIFEIGTYTFILINLFMNNLARPFDFNILNKIYSFNKELKTKKYNKRKSNIFDSTRAYGHSIYRCFRELCIKCGNCLTKNVHEDFYLENSFMCAYSFYFDYTPHIEIINNEHIIKFYVKLSPICKCLTEEMKEEFYSQLVGSTTNAKIEILFKNVDYYHYQFIHAKRRLDLFRKMPLLDLIFNHYQFYEDVFMIIGALLNILLFASLYRTNDDFETIYEYSDDFKYDYGFLYKRKNINITRNIFFYSTLIQSIIAVLILLTYLLNRLSYYLYYEISEEEQKAYYRNLSLQRGQNFADYYNYSQGEPYSLDEYDNMRKNIKFFPKMISFVFRIIKDSKLFYHIIILADCLIALVSQNYRFLALLLVEIIIHSDTLIYIVKSFWLPRKQLLMTLMLFYLIAYYFIIFVYLFIPHHVPTQDCFRFSDCFFTLCDQTIKNSNGIINYLIEDGLYITNTLYQNPRFWIDNFFAIIDLMLVLQMVCGIITDSYIYQRKEKNQFLKNKNNICFICGLAKPELIKYYSHEQGFEEHIKLDHYLWNYMFFIFNLSKKSFDTLINIEKDILDNYKKGNYSNFVPYKGCCRKSEIEEKNLDENGELKDPNDNQDIDNNEED